MDLKCLGKKINKNFKKEITQWEIICENIENTDWKVQEIFF